jgi:hypothetical protein
MESEINKEISDKLSKLPHEEQEKVLEYIDRRIDFISRTEVERRPIWEVIAEISAEIPMEEWEKLPSDGSVNHDHYLYGAPKRY